jgi:outer membrane cobalamin receptor
VSISHTEKQYYYSKKSPYIKGRLNDYTLLNVKVSQAVYKNNVSLYCGVNNLLDEDYEQSYGLPQAGRYIYGGIELSF